MILFLRIICPGIRLEGRNSIDKVRKEEYYEKNK